MAAVMRKESAEIRKMGELIMIIAIENIYNIYLTSAIILMGSVCLGTSKCNQIQTGVCN